MRESGDISDIRQTEHALAGGCLQQLDLPVKPGHLRAARVIEANVPRLTGDDWMFIYGGVTFMIELPRGLRPGAVVEWDDRQDELNCAYTVVTAMTATSITFAHCGRGAKGALAAASAASAMRSA